VPAFYPRRSSITAGASCEVSDTPPFLFPCLSAFAFLEGPQRRFFTLALLSRFSRPPAKAVSLLENREEFRLPLPFIEFFLCGEARVSPLSPSLDSAP